MKGLCSTRGVIQHLHRLTSQNFQDVGQVLQHFGNNISEIHRNCQILKGATEQRITWEASAHSEIDKLNGQVQGLAIAVQAWEMHLDQLQGAVAQVESVQKRWAQRFSEWDAGLRGAIERINGMEATFRSVQEKEARLTEVEAKMRDMTEHIRAFAHLEKAREVWEAKFPQWESDLSKVVSAHNKLAQFPTQFSKLAARQETLENRLMSVEARPGGPQISATDLEALVARIVRLETRQEELARVPPPRIVGEGGGVSPSCARNTNQMPVRNGKTDCTSASEAASRVQGRGCGSYTHGPATAE